MNQNEIKSQNIKRKFVGREVLACVTDMVEYILQQDDINAPFSWDDIENLNIFVCPECGSTDFEETEDEENEEEIYKCNVCNHEFYEPEEHEQVVYEWWIVTDWLGEKLKKHGEVVISDGYTILWGRGTTGQSIYIDNIIDEICSELEILPGQKYEWDI